MDGGGGWVGGWMVTAFDARGRRERREGNEKKKKERKKWSPYFNSAREASLHLLLLLLSPSLRSEISSTKYKTTTQQHNIAYPNSATQQQEGKVKE